MAHKTPSGHALQTAPYIPARRQLLKMHLTCEAAEDLGTEIQSVEAALRPHPMYVAPTPAPLQSIAPHLGA